MTLGGNPIDPAMYGGAAQSLLAWMFVGVPLPPESPPPPASPPVGIQQSSDIPSQPIIRNKVSKAYGGLPMYVDTTGKGPFLGIGAPNLLIGLVQDEKDYDTYFLAKTNPDDDYTTAASREPGGRLKLKQAFADDELAVVAKSELYFSRPTDKFASHFFRDDTLTEVGSGFNPYWQARLIDTNYADRVMALGIQQEQDFVNIVGTFQQLADTLKGMLPF
jgi:hypothetical protein